MVSQAIVTEKICWQASVGIQSQVYVGKCILGSLPDVLSEIHAGKQVLLIKPQGHRLQSSLELSGWLVHTLEIPDGEDGKSVECLTKIWSLLYNLNFCRRDTIVVLGGGSVTDVAGFAAATYLRGLNLVLVPTTLLAQVDAAIGGKTGINFNSGKNLLGTFHFAKAVIVDTDTLSSLPRRQFISGLAEIIKCSIIEKTVAAETAYTAGPKPLFEVLWEAIENLAWDNTALPGIIAACIKMKLSVAANDPLESGLRRCLNLGHTLGHAVESTSNFKISHGEAVAIGMAFALHTAVSEGQYPKSDALKVLSLIRKAGLPATIPDHMPAADLLTALFHDKKREGDGITMVLPKEGPGCVDFSRLVEKPEIERHLSNFRNHELL